MVSRIHCGANGGRLPQFLSFDILTPRILEWWCGIGSRKYANLSVFVVSDLLFVALEFAVGVPIGLNSIQGGADAWHVEYCFLAQEV